MNFFRSTTVLAILCAITGCATTRLTSYTPSENQVVSYSQGIGEVAAETDEYVLYMYPTFKYQSENDKPTFTLMVQNKTDHPIDFFPTNIQAVLDGKMCYVYTLEQRVAEIRTAAKRRQIALAIAGGLVAGAAAYNASHSTTTFQTYGNVGRTNFSQYGIIQTYDPLAGMFAGAAVGAATGIGIRQIANAAGYQERAAQGIFQRSTIQPGTTVIGQIILKPNSEEFSAIKFVIPFGGNQSEISFVKTVTVN